MEKRFVDTAKVILVDPNLKIPLLHRPETDMRKGWDLAGGELLENESPVDAAVREVFEETGLHISPNRLISFPENPYINKSQKGPHVNRRNFFIGLLLVPEPTIRLSKEHDNYQWTNLHRVHLYSMLGHYVQRQVLDLGIKAGMFDNMLLAKQS